MRTKTLQIALDNLTVELNSVKAELAALKHEIIERSRRDNHLLSRLQQKLKNQEI